MHDAKAVQGPAKRVLYTPEEVAEMTGLTRNWIVTKAREGKIPHWREGKLYRFSSENLEWIRERFAQAAHPPDRAGESS